MPPPLREAVRLLLLHAGRLAEGEPCFLPTEMWLCIFSHMHRDWVRAEPEPETAAQRDLRGKLETIEQAVALLSLTIADDPFMKANLQGVFTNYEDQRAELEATLLESGADPARPPS